MGFWENRSHLNMATILTDYMSLCELRSGQKWRRCGAYGYHACRFFCSSPSTWCDEPRPPLRPLSVSRRL